MKARVVLIYPPICPGHKPFYSMPPLGVIYIATVLKNSGIETRVIDAEHEGLTLEETAEQAAAFNPELIGISVMTPVFPSALKLVTLVKLVSKNIRVCFGGAHISATLGETFCFSRDVDYLFVGEAERALVKFVKSGYNTREHIGGLVYVKDGEILYNSKKHFIEDLDSLPYPNFELIESFNLRSYRIPYSNRTLFLPIIASRGCPYNCSFCSVHTIHGRKLRLRNPENVFDEIKQHYIAQGVRYFVFKDSSLTLNRVWIERFCSLLIDNDLSVNWRCNSRPDNVDAQLLRLMKKAGCNLITYGIESGSEYILDRLKKGTTVDDNRRALRETQEAGIYTHSIYIIGSPGESVKTVEDTIKFSMESNSLFVQFGKGIAYPGNEFYEWGIENNVLEDKFWYVKEKPLFKESFLIDPNCGGGLKIDGFNQEYWIRKATLKHYLRFGYILKFIRASFKNPCLILNAILSITVLIKWILQRKTNAYKI